MLFNPYCFYIIKYLHKDNFFKVGITNYKDYFDNTQNIKKRFLYEKEYRNIKNIEIKKIIIDCEKNIKFFENKIKKILRPLRVGNKEDFFWYNSKEELLDLIDFYWNDFLLSKDKYNYSYEIDEKIISMKRNKGLYEIKNTILINKYDCIFNKKPLGYRLIKNEKIEIFTTNSVCGKQVFLTTPGTIYQPTATEEMINNWSLGSKNVNMPFVQKENF